MSDDTALVVTASGKTITLPFDTGLLAGQLRESSQAMYKRDIAAYLAYAQAQGLDALDAATLARGAPSPYLSGERPAAPV